MFSSKFSSHTANGGRGSIDSTVILLVFPALSLQPAADPILGSCPPLDFFLEHPDSPEDKDRVLFMPDLRPGSIQVAGVPHRPEKVFLWTTENELNKSPDNECFNRSDTKSEKSPGIGCNSVIRGHLGP